MAAFIVLLLAALSRFLPHAFHGVGIGFTAVGGGLLFFGSRRSTSLAPAWQATIGVAIMALSDYILTTKIYAYPFHASAYLITWVWYAAVILAGSALLRKVTVLRVTAGILASTTSFFLLSNFAVWAGHQVVYPKSLLGLGMSYVAGLPFYRNDLISTTITAGLLFGLPVVAASLVETMRSAQNRNEPLA